MPLISFCQDIPMESSGGKGRFHAYDLFLHGTCRWSFQILVDVGMVNIRYNSLFSMYNYCSASSHMNRF